MKDGMTYITNELGGVASNLSGVSVIFPSHNVRKVSELASPYSDRHSHTLDNSPFYGPHREVLSGSDDAGASIQHDRICNTVEVLYLGPHRILSTAQDL